MAALHERLARGLHQVGVPFSEQAVEDLLWIAEELLRFNQQVNLTAIRTLEDVIDKHLVDSASALRASVWGNGVVVADVGTGAGFPALPLKVLRPDLRVYAIDSVGKKLRFAEHVAAHFGWEGFETIHGRAEELARGAWRERFDVVVARAVADATVLAEWCLPLTRVGGSWLAMKGPEGEQEADAAAYAIDLLGGAAPEVEAFAVGPEGYRRTLLCVKKVRPTPGRFPRAGNAARKHPLVREGGRVDA